METLLTEAFAEHLDHLSLKGAADLVNFDYHMMCPTGRRESLTSVLLPLCQEFMTSCHFFVSKGGVTERCGISHVSCYVTDANVHCCL